jgi:SAM-dependent methyltransferase
MTESSSADALHNRARWDADADEYQARNREMLAGAEPRWGMWQLPEAELQILGEVAGKDVLEYGCGAAQWSILLAGMGARPVGMDNSGRQLEHARRLQAEAGVEFPLVHASAGDAPLDDASFDVVFCDHGAMTFADPYITVPEVARLLRPGGVFAFSHSTPLSQLSWRDDEEVIDPELHRAYFDLHRIAWQDEAIEFTLPQGDWMRLFRVNGLVVERLHEVQPPEGAESSYRNAEETAWARRWPMEQIWKVRKRWS